MSMGDGRNEKEGENRHHESLSFHVQNGSRSCVLRIRQRTHVKTKRPGKSWPVSSPRATRQNGSVAPAEARVRTVDLQAQEWFFKQGSESAHCVRKFDRP